MIAQLAHRLAQHPSWTSVGWFVILFYAVWSSSLNGTLYYDLHGTNDVSVRVFTFLQMLAVEATERPLQYWEAAAAHGYPASLLTDNGAVFTAAPRGGRCALELECDRLGIRDINSRPYHPQTCGKVERFHQTLKKWLARQDPAATIEELQDHLDRFRAYYNEVRPHRAIGRRPPAEVYAARPKDHPHGPVIEATYRVRKDRIDTGGAVTLRHDSKLLHIKVGRRYAKTRVLMLVAGRDVRIVTEDGELIRELTIDPTKTYQGLGKAEGARMS